MHWSQNELHGIESLFLVTIYLYIAQQFKEHLYIHLFFLDMQT